MYNLKKLAFDMKINNCIHCELADCFAKTNDELCDFIRNVWKLETNPDLIKKYFEYNENTQVVFSEYITQHLTPYTLTSKDYFPTSIKFPLCIEFMYYKCSNTLYVNVRRKSSLFESYSLGYGHEYFISTYPDPKGNMFSIPYYNFSFEDLG